MHSTTPRPYITNPNRGKGVGGGGRGDEKNNHTGWILKCEKDRLV